MVLDKENGGRVPDVISGLLKIITRAFYSDLHIKVIDIILKIDYVSEYTISKELEVSVDKIRLVANSLYSENFIRFEDRIFKKLKQVISLQKKDSFRKIYKLRYWFVDPNSFIWHLKEKIKKIFLKKNTFSSSNEDFFFKCPRKICGKLYSLSEVARIPFNHRTGVLTCDSFLNQRVICGTELIENDIQKQNSKTGALISERKKNFEQLKPIMEILIDSSRLVSSGNQFKSSKIG
mmetsp:Transcript_24080/g.48632  ORF Transcript_24080/g.48632 Transcript_24080/m.48632 type:complete len:235 (+) Transcript_24080:773-1477(+)